MKANTEKTDQIYTDFFDEGKIVKKIKIEKAGQKHQASQLDYAVNMLNGVMRCLQNILEALKTHDAQKLMGYQYSLKVFCEELSNSLPNIKHEIFKEAAEKSLASMRESMRGKEELEGLYKKLEILVLESTTHIQEPSSQPLPH